MSRAYEFKQKMKEDHRFRREVLSAAQKRGYSGGNFRDAASVTLEGPGSDAIKEAFKKSQRRCQ